MTCIPSYFYYNKQILSLKFMVDENGNSACTTIGDYAFYNGWHKNLECIGIPRSIILIHPYAFNGGSYSSSRQPYPVFY